MSTASKISLFHCIFGVLCFGDEYRLHLVMVRSSLFQRHPANAKLGAEEFKVITMSKRTELLKIVRENEGIALGQAYNMLSPMNKNIFHNLIFQFRC